MINKAELRFCGRNFRPQNLNLGTQFHYWKDKTYCETGEEGEMI